MTRTENGPTHTRDIEHDLTKDEALALTDAAARLEKEADHLVAQLKDETKERKDEIKRLQNDAKRKRTAAAERRERRPVPCHQEVRGWNVVVVREDTGEVIEERALEAHEQSDFAGLDTSSPDDLPDPEYTPSETSPKAETEKKPRKARKARR